MPTVKENPFLKRYLQAASIPEVIKLDIRPRSKSSVSVESTGVNTEPRVENSITITELDEIMASEILPLLQTILSRLDVIETKIASAAVAPASGSDTNTTSSSADELPKSIRAYDSYTLSFLEPFVNAAKKLGGDAGVMGTLTQDAFNELRVILLKAAACKEPPQTKLPEVLGPLSAKMKEIGTSVKRNEWEKHGKTVSEGLGALNWVVVKPAPRDFIENFIGGSDYYGNGIRKEFRTTNPDQIAYVDTFKTLLIELMAYVKEFHATGLSWNPKGIDISEYSSTATSTTAVPTVTKTTTIAPKPASGLAAKPASNAPAPALFSALNKGENITSGLKTVTKDMQTWRKEYKSDDAPAPVKVAPKVAPRVAETVKGPPKLEFQAGVHKWIVENQSSEATVTITDKRETVYIYGCIGASVNVVGKCKSIIVDSCKKTKVYFDEALATAEVVNSQRIEIHVREKVPSVAIDKTDGIVVYIPKTSIDSTIVASKSSEMNVSFPGPDGESIERPIPEQYVHKISGVTITADVSDLYSH